MRYAATGGGRVRMNARPGPLGLDCDAAGLCLRALDLYLDPIAPGPPGTTTFVSHVHAWAAAAGARVLASPETIALARVLGADGNDARVIEWAGARELPIRAAYGGGTARLTIARAGHVLGAAQLVVDHPRGRLVYTGDWARQGDGVHPAGEVIACDELVVASTFGLPIFRFEPAERVARALAGWCSEQRAQGLTPTVLAASPGPAQTLAWALEAAAVPFVAEGTIAAASAAYVAAAAWPASSAVAPRGDPAPPPPNAVVILPPNARAPAAKTRGARAVAYASGWALLDTAVDQRRADAAFPIATLADFDELIELVDASGARVIHATRGEAGPFAHCLRAKGFAADSIDLAAIDARSVT
jgi:hypothetical protein